MKSLSKTNKKKILPIPKTSPRIKMHQKLTSPFPHYHNIITNIRLKNVK